MLAAGQSRRFGPEDKLLAPFRERPLVDHAAEALAGAELDHLIAVVTSPEVQARLERFDCVLLGSGTPPQSQSLRTGIARAEALSADRVIVTLADMPLVTSDVLNAVLSRAGGAQMGAATDGTRRTPPAAFPKSVFPELRSLTGDRGAGPLLQRMPEAQLVKVPPDQLSDVDTPEDLVRLTTGPSP